MNRAVNLTKRVKLNGQYRFCPVVVSGNGRVKPDYVLVDGNPERHPEGAYSIEWRENGKRKRQSVGRDAGEATARKDRQERILNCKVNGIKVVETTAVDGPALAQTVDAYLGAIKISRKPKTHAAYEVALNYFLESCNKSQVSAIDRNDLLQYAAYLRDSKHLSPRSCRNKFESVMSFLKAHGIRGASIQITKHDWPQYTEDEPEVYEQDELDKFFGACDGDEALWFKFFLMTGLREQEVRYCTWDELNLTQKTVTVRYKGEYGFSPKAYRGRSIPIPDELAATLKSYKAKRDRNCPLLFPTKGCKPKFDFLDVCKAVAKRAGLDSSRFWLHKFRATFATWHLWNGVDFRTLQSWMGHVDMESTLRYLRANRSPEVREKVNGTFSRSCA